MRHLGKANGLIVLIITVIICIVWFSTALYNAPSPKIVSKKMHKINYGGGLPLSVTYKILTETEVEEVVKDKENFYATLDQIVKQNGEILDSAIFKWDVEFEAGETIVCNGNTYTYDSGIHYLEVPDKGPILDTKYSFQPHPDYEKYINNELDQIERDIKGTKDRFFLTRIDVPNSYKGIYVDIRVGTPDRVRDLTYSWIAKGYGEPIVLNHPGHNAALEYAKKNKMGMWGGNTTDTTVHEGQDSTFIELPKE